MARLLISQWQLAVLQVELDLTHRTPRVSTTLSAYRNGEPRVLWRGRFHTESFGVDEAPLGSLTVPAKLSKDLTRVVNKELRNESALWLRLVEPYGYLGAVPWEDMELPLPVLRVPARLPMVPVVGKLWNAALVIDAHPRSSWSAPYVAAFIAALQHEITDRIEVDIFCDIGTFRALEGSDLGSQEGVRVHNPSDAAEASGRPDKRSPGATIPNPAIEPSSGRYWADWVAAGLAGRSIRALHIVADGAFDATNPALLVRPDPAKPTARSRSTIVMVENLMGFINSLGAATVSLGAPCDSGSSVAIRMIADRVGQHRSGGTFFVSLADDPEAIMLGQVEAFLGMPQAGRDIPRHPGLFIYAQPEHIIAEPSEPFPSPYRGLRDQSEDETSASVQSAVRYHADPMIARLYQDATTVPSWVTASDGYLARQWTALAKSSSSTIPTTPTRNAYDEGAAAALMDIQNIVEQHAGPSS
jgi:hypothetical protein